MVGGVRGVESKNNSGFELCCLFFTSTPSFIQIGPKLAKLAYWGGLHRGRVVGVVGKVGVVGSKKNSATL